MDGITNRLLEAYDLWYIENVMPDYNKLTDTMFDITFDQYEESVHVATTGAKAVTAGFMGKTLFSFIKNVFLAILSFIKRCVNRFVYFLTGFDLDKKQKITLANGKTVKINFEDDLSKINSDINDMNGSMKRAINAEKRRDIFGMKREKKNMKNIISRKDKGKALSLVAGVLLLTSVVNKYKSMSKELDVMVASINPNTLKSTEVNKKPTNDKKPDDKSNSDKADNNNNNNNDNTDDEKELSNLEKEVSTMYANFIKDRTSIIDKAFRLLHVEQAKLKKTVKEFSDVQSNKASKHTSDRYVKSNTEAFRRMEAEKKEN